MSVIKRLFVGRPLATTEMEHQKIPKVIALAVYSSDAISSTAYATEEILFVTALGASSLALGLNVLAPIAIAVAVLLAIVISSYRQVIFAYPDGGGSYVVSRENLGENPSLVDGASLMVDYVLTVAVSISAGVAAIVSIPAFRGLQDKRVLIGLILIGAITLANLRGVREAGRLFAVPTYLYMAVVSALILWGLARSFFPGVFGSVNQVPFDAEAFEGMREAGGTLTIFLILKGFSSGAVALTGIEAISNGVPSFRRPESRNAATTLVYMGIVLGTLFFGISLLAQRLHPYPSHDQTVFAQLGLVVFGNGVVFLVLQLSTAAILTLAANTAFNGFPQLTSIIAKDGYLPRQFANRGDRLVFSNGVVFLGGAAAVLLVAFGGITTALIPLYAVGVFTSFTLAQVGMVRHHLRHRQAGWQRSLVINAAGAVVTGVVMLVISFTKFTDGAWVPIVVIPAIVVLFKAIKRHYSGVARALKIPDDYKPPKMNHTVIVLVGNIHRGVLPAIAYARSMRPNRLVAVSVATSEEDHARLERQWEHYGIDVPLDILFSPYRELTRPVMRYVDEIDARWENDIVTVVIPEFVVHHWWEHLLHNQSALILKGRLLFRRGTVVTSVPYHID